MNLGGPERINDVGPFLYNLFSDPEIIRTPFPAFQKPLAWLISTLRSTTSQQAYLSIRRQRQMCIRDSNSLHISLEPS